MNEDDMKIYKYLSIRLLSIIISWAFSEMTQAQSIDSMAEQYLTGNWKGVRQSLKENGITFQPRISLFYQGTSKGDNQIIPYMIRPYA